MHEHKKISLFGLQIDVLSMQQSVELIAGWLLSVERKNQYVVTPNVDHIVNLENNAPFQAAYANASLVVADGKPVVLASKLLGKALPGTVPGSDLVPKIFDHFEFGISKPLSVFLLGAMPGVAEKAKAKIEAKWPRVNVIGLYSPEFGFDKSIDKSKKIAEMVAATNADMVVFGVGAPKQELWSHQYGHLCNTKAILCVGATIDFLAGEKARAPVWMQKIGMEWCHRMLTEPKRLVKRYAIGALIFPQLFYRAWKTGK